MENKKEQKNKMQVIKAKLKEMREKFADSATLSDLSYVALLAEFDLNDNGTTNTNRLYLIFDTIFMILTSMAFLGISIDLIYDRITTGQYHDPFAILIGLCMGLGGLHCAKKVGKVLLIPDIKSHIAKLKQKQNQGR